MLPIKLLKNVLFLFRFYCAFTEGADLDLLFINLACNEDKRHMNWKREIRTTYRHRDCLQTKS